MTASDTLRSCIKKRLGRPVSGHQFSITVRLRKEELGQLKKIADEEQTTKSDALRRLLNEALKARKNNESRTVA
jgi:hypothetical protein